ncbi:hypothetical protein HHX47_DHR10000072 [Lentinula edodes]|nr:hypothetical protein HHX47_DHR10000072 [Lentinula edodes]
MKRDIIDCNSDSQGDAFLGLRIASIFVIYIGSSCGALFPVLARRSKFINVPKSLFEYVSYRLLDALSLNNDPPSSIRFAKFFGSGVIIATAFIHLLSPALDELGSPCLSEAWNAHGHDTGSHAAHGPEGSISNISKDVEAVPSEMTSAKSEEHQHPQMVLDSAISQVIGVAILEFGVVLHRYNFVPITGAVVYGFTTPIGIAIGLGLRTTYNPNSPTASIVSGVLDSLSSGILIYTGLVELLAHEFLFNKEMMECSNARLTYALGSMLLGCGVMALLGKWA